MRKKKILIALITILLLPLSINAAVRNNYDITKKNTNIYINDFDKNDVYIIKSTPSFNVPFIYNNGALSVDTYFKKGGLLNRYEFLVSKTPENDTYLFTGNNYWTLTENGTKVYMIDNSAADNISLQEKTTLSGGRITEYIREETGVSGSGKYMDPWVFIERFKVTAKSSNTSWGTVTPSEKYANKGEKITFSISPGSEYEYSNNDCGATYSNGKLTLSDIQADKDCIVNFKNKAYTLTYNNNGGSGCTSKNFVKNQKVGTLCVPTKTTNEFAGWYTSATGGTEVTSDTVLSKATTVYAHWTPTCFAFTPSTGTITDYYDYKGNDSSNGSCPRSVTIPSTISGKTVLKIGNSSFEEKNITSVTIPNTVTEIGYSAFSKNSITSLTIPSSVKQIKESAFYQNNISTLNLNTGLEYIGSSAFYKNKLTTLTTPSTLTKIDSSAFYQNNISTLSLNEGLTYIGSSAFYNNSITSVKTPSSLETIGYSTFKENNISSLTLNDGLKSIGDFAFFKNKIPNVTIPTTVTSLGNASFNDNQLPDSIATLYKRSSDGSEDKTTVVSYGGSNRADVIVSSTVKTINPYAYYQNYIRKITLPEGLTKIDSDGLAFNSLSEIKLPSTTNYLGSFALYANSLRSIDYNNSVITYMGNAVVNANYLDDSQAFVYAKNSDGTDDKTKLISYGGSNRSTVTVPNNVKEIGNSAFFSDWISSVILPEGLETIGTSAFHACSLSGSVILPSTVTSIGSSAFIKTTRYSRYNTGITEIVNKTGKSFKWHTILNNDYYNYQEYPTVYQKTFEFETGTVINPAGNVTITK